MQYYKEFNLKNYNSFHLDSVAKEIYFPESNGELQSLLIELKGQKFYILSYGTNIVLAPKINKIICLRKMPSTIKKFENGFVVQANAFLNTFIKTVLKNGYSGVEGLLGIPGSIGAAICGNSGSGNYCISENLTSIWTMDSNGEFHHYYDYDLNFSRRYSVIQILSDIILSATFVFPKTNVDKEIINKTIEYRKTLPKYPSAGGLFKNWHELKPYSSKLIGLRIGDAEVSEKVNIIVNKGNATYNDIISLIEEIKSIVRVPLELEVKIFKD